MSTKARRPRVIPTARAIVLHKNRVLFLSAQDPGRPWYFLPGGGVKHGETLKEAVAREVYEETKVNVMAERLLYIREFIASRHERRSQHMPEDWHVVASVFLCKVDNEVHGDADLSDIAEFQTGQDGATGVTGIKWVSLEDISEIEIMPPQVKQALLKDFPPPPENGIEFWPEDD